MITDPEPLSEGAVAFCPDATAEIDVLLASSPIPGSPLPLCYIWLDGLQPAFGHRCRNVRPWLASDGFEMVLSLGISGLIQQAPRPCRCPAHQHARGRNGEFTEREPDSMRQEHISVDKIEADAAEHRTG